MIPTDSERLLQLRQLLAEPRRVKREMLDVMRDNWQYADTSERELLRELDRRFFRPLDELGARRRGIAEDYWRDRVVPLLNALEVNLDD